MSTTHQHCQTGPRIGRIPLGRLLVGLLAVVLGAAALAVLAAPASAAPRLIGSFWGNPTTSAGVALGQFGTGSGIAGVAINQTGAGGVAAGDVYVVDRGSNRVQQFSESGTPRRAFGLNVGGPGVNVCTASCAAGTASAAASGFSAPQGIAVDQASGLLYVTDQTNRRVDVYSPVGAFLGAFGWGVSSGAAALQFCTTSCQAGVAGAGSGQFGSSIGYPAVDPTSGDLYVADTTNRRVQEFRLNYTSSLPSGVTFVRAFGFGVQDGTAAFQICTIVCQAGSPAGTAVGQFGATMNRVAVDGDGSIYVVDTGTNTRVQRFDRAGLLGDELTASVVGPNLVSGKLGIKGNIPTTNPLEIAVDPGSNHLFVVRASTAGETQFCPNGVESVAERRILEFDRAGALVDTHLACSGLGVVNGLAVRSSADTGDLYITSTVTTPRVYRVTSAGSAAPTATVDPPSTVTGHTATLAGSVSANDAAFSVGWHFEYRAGVGTWLRTPATDTVIAAGAGATPVSAPVTGLQGNQSYQVRLVTTKQFSSAQTTSTVQSFQTPALPLENVATLPAQAVRSTSAQLVGTLNANNRATTYRFEYGPTTAYGASTPATDASGGATSTVIAQVRDLTAGTLYHYRIVASNADGSVPGSDNSFLTRANLPVDDRGVPLSPEGRAYEMVTPPDKPSRRQGFVGANDASTSLSGYPSVSGNSILLDGVQGSVWADAGGGQYINRYRLVRRSDGWQTQPILNRSLDAVVFGQAGNIAGASAEQDKIAFSENLPVLPSGTTAPSPDGYTYTRYMDDPPAWATADGWSSWALPDQKALASAEVAEFSEDGRYQVRASPFRGLLGPSDPSNGQTAGIAGGSTVYRQDLDTGSRELVNGCTGAGTGSTDVLKRVGTGSAASDTVDTQPCSAGSVTSVRGATLGGGSTYASGSSIEPGLGTAANAVSSDGRTVFFTSPDPASKTGTSPPGTMYTCNSGAVTDCPPQLFVRRWDAQGIPHVAWISRSRSALQPDGSYGGAMIAGQQIGEVGRGVAYEGASQDGSVVYFRTNAPLTPDDPNGGVSITTGVASPQSWDLYAYTLPADPAHPEDGTLRRVSGGPAGTADPNTSCSSIGTGAAAGTCNDGPTAGRAAGVGAALRYLSDDGTRAYFVTTSPIAGADNTLPHNGSAGPGGTQVNADTRDLYLYDSTKSGGAGWKFITQIKFSLTGMDGCAADYSMPGFTIAPDSYAGSFLNPGGVIQNSCVFGARKGHESGDVVTFMSGQQLTADDTDSAIDVYAYDSSEDTLSRLSVPQGGAGGAPYVCAGVTCNADLNGVVTANTVRPLAGSDGARHALTADDGTVFFETRRQLLPDDVNDQHMDVYGWKDGELQLISPGTSPDDAFLGGTSYDGKSVFFQTSQPIDAREIDPGDTDVYVARVGGGFPPPKEPASCVASACQGPQAPVPFLAQGGSPAQTESQAAVRAPTFSVAAVTAAQKKRLAAGRATSLSVTVSEAGRLQAAGVASIRKRSVAVASAHRNVTRGGAFSLSLSLSKAARSELAAKRRLTIKIAVTYSKAAVTQTATVRLVAPKAKRPKAKKTTTAAAKRGRS